MPSSETRALTDRPARYLKQLVQHFGNKMETELTDSTGVIRFESGTATLTAEPGVLVLHATALDDERLARVQHVVISHAERFGAKDELKFAESIPVAG